MVQLLATALKTLPPANDLISNFWWSHRRTIASHGQSLRGPPNLFEDPPTIRLRLGHAGLSSLFTGCTQRIEKNPESRDIANVDSVTNECRPVDLFWVVHACEESGSKTIEELLGASPLRVPLWGCPRRVGAEL